jgi:tRNA pseudouridine38-40 synthase
MSIECCYVLLSIEYHGGLYGGWQRQGKQGEDLSLPLQSVQQVVEFAAARVLNEDFITCVQVAGRTDKGVHALDQRCALRVPITIDLASFLEKMNAQLRLNHLIAVCSADFHPNEKFVVVKKRYKYVLQIPRSQQNKRPVECLHQYSRHESRKVDLDLLKNALQLMVGTHDFQHLSKQKEPKANTTRTVYAACISVASTSEDLPSFRIASTPAWNVGDHEFCTIHVEGSGFLWHQVRRMVSLTLKVAQGSWPMDSVLDVLEGKRIGPASAPARGLYLDRVWLAGEGDI